MKYPKMKKKKQRAEWCFQRLSGLREGSWLMGETLVKGYKLAVRDEKL